MESWLAAARILLLTIILELLTTSHTRDFFQQDIIYLHPSTTPFPGGFKCFTCEDAQDNFECNRWAPDVFCPREAKYCYTRHSIDEEGDSVSVTKRCAAPDDCLPTGCTQTHHKVCTACCEGNICNLSVPWNQTDAIFTAKAPLSSSRGSSKSLTGFLITASLLLPRAL